MDPFSPKLPPGVRRLFRLPPSRDRLLREMDEERDAHLALRVDALRRLGMSPADAEAEARRRFGDPGAFRDYAARRAGRRARRLAVARWLAEGVQDLRVAWRQIRRAPAFAAVVVVTLAGCIGVTTAAYGVVRHLLLAPLPYPDGNRIVSLAVPRPEDGEFRFLSAVPAALFRQWAGRARTLENFAALAWRPPPAGDGTGDGGAQDAWHVGLVTPSFLPMLRVRPALGRGFTPDDARPGAPAVALLGDRVWRSRYGGDPGVVGRAIPVDRVLRTVVGVVPRGVGVPSQGSAPVDVWLPLRLDTATLVGGAFARLRPGATSADASRELEAILRTFPDTGALAGRYAAAQTAPEQVDPWRRRAVEVLLVAAVGLLLLGCADVAGLLLMRGWARRREFAVRRVLGAGRARLARQLLAEGLLLAVPSGALGLCVAWLGLRAAVALRPGALDFLDAVHLDGAALAWTACAAVATALLFGAAPALAAGGPSLDGALRAGGAGGGAGGGTSRAAGRAHAALVVGQLALSLVFLATAGVLARSFVALARTPVGYDPAGLVAVAVRSAPETPPARGAARRLTPAEQAGVASTRLETLRAALAATPGVRDVAVGTLPLTNMGTGPSAVEGPTGVPRPGGVPITGLAYVGPDYFRVTRIPLVEGRGFDRAPAVAASEVVVNRVLARRLWPDRDALGARLRLGDGAGATWLTVVGVAGDVRMPGSAAEFFGLQMYRPATAAPPEEPARTLLLRAGGKGQGDAALRPTLARAVARAGVGATLGDVVTAESTLEYAFGAPRFAVALCAAFALLAVTLAAAGLFGIVMYAVARRTREIGVRMALGADRAVLTRAILGRSLGLAAAGCGIGLIGAVGASGVLRALVTDVSPADPAALGVAVALLAGVAVAAAALPLRRALRVDPTDALRAE